ncbi:MAG TPA: F0F1 ATP synthase subunit delta [Gammaproteobacteria bacterium]|nr:F0F1 ATP synthase subunit delta [Gammaproteobacteria bacterium]
MSELITAARPYAKAAFLSASEHDAYDIWDEKLAFLEQVVSEHKVKSVINGPRLSREEKAQLVIDLCQPVPEEIENFIKIMAENSRLTLMPYVRVLFEGLRSSAGGLVKADVVSATELDEVKINKLRDALEKRFNKSVSVNVSTDQSLVSGVLIRVGDIVIDGSLKGRIEKLTHALAV